MESILDIYKRVYNPLNPVVCFDESSKQQIQDLVDALPVRSGTIDIRYTAKHRSWLNMAEIEFADYLGNISIEESQLRKRLFKRSVFGKMQEITQG